jgi:hypothetical protein
MPLANVQSHAEQLCVCLLEQRQQQVKQQLEPSLFSLFPCRLLWSPHLLLLLFLQCVLQPV